MAKSVFMKERAEIKEVSICLMEVCTMSVCVCVCMCVYVCVCVCGSALPSRSVRVIICMQSYRLCQDG